LQNSISVPFTISIRSLTYVLPIYYGGNVSIITKHVSLGLQLCVAKKIK